MTINIQWMMRYVRFFYMYTHCDLVLDAARLKCASVPCIVALIFEIISRQVLRNMLSTIIFYNHLLTINGNNNNDTRSFADNH